MTHTSTYDNSEEQYRLRREFGDRDDGFGDEQPSREEVLRGEVKSPSALEGGGFRFGVYELVGHGKVTNGRCGTFAKFLACSRVELHNKMVFDVKTGSLIDFSGKADVHPIFYSCDKPSCPICYERGWAVREAGNINFHLYVYKKSDTTVVVSVVAERLTGDVLLLNNSHTVDAGWWGSVDVSMKVWHEGNGYFKASFGDVIYTGSYSPSVSGVGGDDIWYRNLFGSIASAVSKVLPAWLRDTLGAFSAWFGSVFPFAGVLINTAVQLLPFAPFILLFWVLDAGMTSVHEGSFTPIGVCASAIWSAMAQIVNAIVSIATGIYDFIHFW